MKVGKEIIFHGVTCTPLEVWNIDNHSVAWIRFEAETEYSYHLMCDCDFRESDKPYTYGGTDDPKLCQAKKAVEQERLKKTQCFYTEALKTDTLENAVEEIFHRVHDKGDFLGQRMNLIYAQEVAAMVSRPLRELLAAIETLYAQDKLELNGMILQPFRHQFRFPAEIRSLLRFMIEEPLGWPNGDAGDCFLEEVERAIDAGTHFKHGREAFGYGGNWPRLAPHIKALFGSKWLAEALTFYMARAAQGDEASQGRVDEITAFFETWLNLLKTGKPHSGNPPTQ